MSASSRREVAFQLVLHLVVFIFYAFDKDTPHLQAHHVPFFINYVLAALCINYALLPHYYYRKRHWTFALLAAGVVALCMWVEEGMLEPIYFPGVRADNFPGVFFTLVQILPVITILVGFKFGWDALIKQHQLDTLQAAVKVMFNNVCPTVK